jgi:hypothetical protein
MVVLLVVVAAEATAAVVALASTSIHQQELAHLALVRQQPAQCRVMLQEPQQQVTIQAVVVVLVKQELKVVPMARVAMAWQAVLLAPRSLVVAVEAVEDD